MIYIAVGTVAALMVATMVGTACMWPMINEVETGATPEYPEIQPHYYSTDSARIYEEALASVDALERWEVADRDRSQRRIEAERTTRLLRFVDDITIRVEPVTEYVAQVHVRSASRVGEADFGQNARNIEEFFDELDERLGAVKFDPDEAVPKEETEPELPDDEQTGEG